MATVAFGLGLDKSDVNAVRNTLSAAYPYNLNLCEFGHARELDSQIFLYSMKCQLHCFSCGLNLIALDWYQVIHYGLPNSLEHYMQVKIFFAMIKSIIVLWITTEAIFFLTHRKQVVQDAMEPLLTVTYLWMIVIT